MIMKRLFWKKNNKMCKGRNVVTKTFDLAETVPKQTFYALGYLNIIFVE